MRWLLFLSRLSFTAGIFLLLSLSLLIVDWVKEEAISSTIIIIGQLFSLLLLPLVVLLYAVIGIAKKGSLVIIPLWLRVTNFLFFLFLLLYIYLQNVQ